MKYEITCQECESNFDVQHESVERVEYCPFCGEWLEDQEPEEEWEEDLDDE